jgi:hypothetical protein
MTHGLSTRARFLHPLLSSSIQHKLGALLSCFLSVLHGMIVTIDQVIVHLYGTAPNNNGACHSSPSLHGPATIAHVPTAKDTIVTLNIFKIYH